MKLYAEPTELTAEASALLAAEATLSATLLQLALLCLQIRPPPPGRSHKPKRPAERYAPRRAGKP